VNKRINSNSSSRKLERSIHDQIFSATWNEPEVEEVTSSVGAACTVHCDTIKWSASIYDERVWDDVKIKGAPATPRTHRTLRKIKERALVGGAKYFIVLSDCSCVPGARSREVALFCLKWHLGARAALFATSVVVNSGCPNLMGEMGLIRFLDAPGDKVSRRAQRPRAFVFGD